MKVNIIKELHSILKPYDYICPPTCCLCEKHENMILLSNEENIISHRTDLITRFIKHESGFYYLNATTNCPYFFNHKKNKCIIYEDRPIDCRIFPFYPTFNLITNTYILNINETYCPISQKIKPDMNRDVKIVLDVINRIASTSWKETYNKLNNIRLKGKRIQLPEIKLKTTLKSDKDTERPLFL